MLPPLREWCHRHLGTARGDAAYRCVRRCMWLYACVYLYVRYAVACALFTPLSVRTWQCMENFVTEVLRYDLWMLAVRKMSERGHEIGNHTFSHPCSARKGAVTAGNELENYTVDQVRGAWAGVPAPWLGSSESFTTDPFRTPTASPPHQRARARISGRGRHAPRESQHCARPRGTPPALAGGALW